RAGPFDAAVDVAEQLAVQVLRRFFVAAVAVAAAGQGFRVLLDGFFHREILGHRGIAQDVPAFVDARFHFRRQDRRAHHEADAHRARARVFLIGPYAPQFDVVGRLHENVVGINHHHGGHVRRVRIRLLARIDHFLQARTAHVHFSVRTELLEHGRMIHRARADAARFRVQELRVQAVDGAVHHQFPVDRLRHHVIHVDDVVGHVPRADLGVDALAEMLGDGARRCIGKCREDQAVAHFGGEAFEAGAAAIDVAGGFHVRHGLQFAALGRVRPAVVLAHEHLLGPGLAHLDLAATVQAQVAEHGNAVVALAHDQQRNAEQIAGHEGARLRHFGDMPDLQRQPAEQFALRPGALRRGEVLGGDQQSGVGDIRGLVADVLHEALENLGIEGHGGGLGLAHGGSPAAAGEGDCPAISNGIWLHNLRYVIVCVNRALALRDVGLRKPGKSSTLISRQIGKYQ
ncbi:conserved hypothetical protein, partial [Ricinus communis]